MGREYKVSIPLPQTLKLPDEKKMFDIILHTAKQTRENPQLEIVLKVKEENNMVFDFLQMDSTFHAFYIFTKGLSDEEFWSLYLGKEIRNKTALVDDNSLSKEKNNNALQLLLSDYNGRGESEEKEDVDDHVMLESTFSRLSKAERLQRAQSFALHLQCLEKKDGSIEKGEEVKEGRKKRKGEDGDDEGEEEEKKKIKKETTMKEKIQLALTVIVGKEFVRNIFSSRKEAASFD